MYSSVQRIMTALLLSLWWAIPSTFVVDAQYIQYTRSLSNGDTTGTNGDRLGSAVVMSGTTIVAGAPGANSNAGEILIFQQNETDARFFLAQTLTGDEVDAGDFFGSALAMTPTRLVVGANLDEETGLDGGAVYIFDLQDDNVTWAQVQYIPIPDATEEDQFGRSVDISSTGDRIIVGAFQRSTVKSNKGSAFIYDWSGSSFTLTQEIALSDTEGFENDFFGRSVSIEGDAALVGAFRDTVNEVNSQGSVFHFQYNGATWELADQIISSDGAQDDRLGTAHEMDATRAVVAAPFDDDPTKDEGSVYLYSRQANGLNFEEKLLASDGAIEDLYGSSLKLQGDKLIVGSPFHDTDGVTNSGKAYIYFDFYGTNDFLEFQQLQPKEPIQGEGFGTSVAIDDEYIVVGAVPEDPVNNPGAVYFFGPDEGSQEPSAAPSVPPSAAPTEGFEVCAPIYKCEPRFDIWPFNRGPKTYVHRFTGRAPEGETCEIDCIFEANFLDKNERGWECGLCLF